MHCSNHLRNANSLSPHMTLGDYYFHLASEKLRHTVKYLAPSFLGSQWCDQNKNSAWAE